MTLKQIQATQQIMRLAINSQNHVDSLIGYYRDMIDKFNQEKIEWSLYYQGCKDNVKNRHLIEKQIEFNHVKNLDLGDQLASLKGELTYERQKYFNKVQENQKFKRNLLQNKKRLQQLIQICKPLSIENSGVKSVCSVKTKAPFNNSVQKQKLTQNKYKQNLNTNRQELQLKLINIYRDHDQKKKNLQKTVDQLKIQLQQLLSQHSNRGSQCAKEYQNILNKISELQLKHMNLVSEFFKFRTNNIQQEQKIQQQNQIIRLKNMALIQKLKLLQQSHTTQFKMIDNQVKKKNKQFKQKYDEQLKKKEQHLSILKEQHERISDIYLNKLKKIQGQLRSTTQKTLIIQQKTKYQVSSLKSQIKILNNRLQNVAMNHMRNEIIQNGEDQSQQNSSVTLQMEQLERINKEVKDLQKQLQKNTGSKI